MIAPDWWRHFFSGLAVEMWLRATSEEQTRREADFIESALQLRTNARVLDVPCGGGRHSLELAARGYRVTGLDISAEFLAVAKKAATDRQLSVDWQQREMTDLPWPAAFDGAFCFGNSFGYLDDDSSAAFFAAVARAIKPRARIVMETGIAWESLCKTFQERREIPLGDMLFQSRGTYDPASARVETEYTFTRAGVTEKKTASVRVYGYRELCSLLTAAGFGDIEGYGSLDREPFRLGSPILYLVAAKSSDRA
jgi:SAM-dependent methyltransferase